MAHQPLTVLIAIHCHQPVGNFDFVFEEAYRKAYEPFINVLERHPSVRLALHYSGPLLEWLSDRQPRFLQRIKALVLKGQVELLTSGYAEPILPLLPEVDRQGQIAAMQAAIKRTFKVSARGLWLTERVWEPDLPATLARAGARYTIVDANHFSTAKAMLPRSFQFQEGDFWDLLGSYATDYGGSSVTVFPASKRLRYWIPFAPVEESIGFLKRLHEQSSGFAAAITFADDGEKFGLWPGTHEWVYEHQWLEQFFSALEKEKNWLATSTFSDYTKQVSPVARAYLPSASYEEMLDWSGGHFRNFFSKYPEAGTLLHRMLRVSHRLQEAKERYVPAARAGGRGRRAVSAKTSQLLAQAQAQLYQGQCNCAYWHGVFGGLYLSHLRRAVYRHLISAEMLVDSVVGTREGIEARDWDGDGCDEIRVKTADMALLLDPSEGGSLIEWDAFGPRVNIIDTITRRQEPYHKKLHQESASAGAGSSDNHRSSGIHDVLGVKEQGLGAELVYDRHRRSSFLDYGLNALPSYKAILQNTWAAQELWAAMAPMRCEELLHSSKTVGVTLFREVPGGWVRKTSRLDRKQARLECLYELNGSAAKVVALEFNLGIRDLQRLKEPGQHSSVKEMAFEDPDSKYVLHLSTSTPARVVHFPVHTVSESEGGLERTYQGLSVVCFWERASVQKGTWQLRLEWQLQQVGHAKRKTANKSGRAQSTPISEAVPA